MSTLWFGFPLPLRGLLSALLLCMALPLAACSNRIGHAELTSDLHQGQLARLVQEAEKKYTPGKDFQQSLTLARLYQLQGEWARSIHIFNDAADILDEYEHRATHSVRDISAQIGTFTLSRGAKGYFGAGYERSLLHTFNGMNYLMLGNIQGAAVEMRKMEFRQERWLAESKAIVENMPRAAKQARISPEDLPPSYSMRSLLASEAGRRLMSTYQDAFSYTLSSIICSKAGDTQYAKVSAKRATALAPSAADLLHETHAAKGKTSRKKGAGKGKAAKTKAANARKNLKTDDSAQSPPPSRSGKQDVVFIVTTGLAPSMYIERVRTRFPVIGYFVLDMPSFHPPMFRTAPPQIFTEAGDLIAPQALLFTDALAFRSLWDNLRYETAAAYIRAGLKAAAASGAYAAAYSSEELRPYSGLVALATTVITDFGTAWMDDGVRNWDTLPCNGFLARTTLAPGETLTLTIDDMMSEIPMPAEGNTVFVWVSYVTPNQLKVHYVTM
ncbi:hypothetical protein LJC46_00450 [Desulfovibrio sp. OttesenSCG-928-G15]|nr:hypothetical protein [Desulfovibrio sp. OttesenSCG-928-G15]